MQERRQRQQQEQEHEGPMVGFAVQELLLFAAGALEHHV